MRYLGAKNLRCTELTEVRPYEFSEENLVRVPKRAFEDKGIRTSWATSSETDWNVFTCHEGIASNLRIGKTNPIHSTYGLAIDYDVKLSPAEIDAFLTRCGNRKPNRLETSLSGNLLAIWEFERAINWPTPEFFDFAITRIEDIIPFRNAVGVDEGALTESSRLFTNGCKWRVVHDNPLSHDLLIGWLQEVSKKFSWNPSGRITIPLDVVAAELTKRYPRFSEWPGEFTEGSAGPTFWADGSTSPKSAFVTAEGIWSFAAHASHKPYMTWTDLLDADFVKSYRFTQIGKALDGVYYDSRHFIHRQLEGHWQYDSVDEFSRYLRTEHGISDRRPKGLLYSPLDEAIQHVKNTSLIASAGSFAFYPKGVFLHQGKKLLNIHNVDVLQPVEAGTESKKWGDGFPWIASYLDGFLTTTEQKELLLAHTAHAYRCNYARCPQSGQAVTLVGRAGVGKTFFARELVGRLMNGFAEAEAYFLGNDNFNSELFEVAVWCIDDGKAAVSPQKHQTYTEGMKRAVANPAHRSNEKFRRAALVFWQGRVYITCNVDAESMRAAPALDQSTSDKIIMLLCTESRTDGFSFPSKPEIEAILSRELPHFARWLLDWEIPAHCFSDEKRFGIRAYQEPTLSREVNQNSKAAICGELVDMFLTSHFKMNPEKDCWEGTVSNLHSEIAADPAKAEQLRAWPVPAMARALTTLATQDGWDIQVSNTKHRRIFVICRGSRFPKLPSAAPLKQTPNSKYQKANERSNSLSPEPGELLGTESPRTGD